MTAPDPAPPPPAEPLPPGAGQRALAIAVAASACLALGKFALGMLSGSLVVVASAADSFSDAVMSALNWWGYRHARIPPDEDHPYGHGKFEGAFAVGQGMLLLGVVVSIVGSAASRLLLGAPLPRVGLASATLVGSGLAAAALTFVLSRARARDRSVVLEADAAHYRIDMLSALGGVGGLALVHLTGWGWLDPALSIALALLMAREAARVLRKGAAELLDEGLPEEEVARVRAVLDRNAAALRGYHGLRTRRSGPLRFVEVHVLVDPARPFGDVHELVQELGRQIHEALPGTRVLVHPDAVGLVDRVDRHLGG